MSANHLSIPTYPPVRHTTSRSTLPTPSRATLRTALLAGVLLMVALLSVAVLPGCGSTSSADGPSGTGDSAPAGNGLPIEANDVAPAANGLDPGLVEAFEQAQRAAAEDGHVLVINSGHRTVERQQELLDEAVVEHGSLEAASRWVFPPDRSMHVQGLAVDVGDRRAAEWLAHDGWRWGLCRTLSWEWWHFEWRSRWEGERSCPAPATDPVGAPAP